MTEEEALTTLKVDDPTLAATAEAMLWSLWCRSAKPEVEKLLRAGVEAMQRRKLDEAEGCFTRVIELAPDFAEGWNKRATVHWRLGNHQDSLADIARTLALEPRHFGALSGRGLVYTELEKWDLALASFDAALAVNPTMPCAPVNAVALRHLFPHRAI